MPLKFLVDESTGVQAARFLKSKGFDTLSATEKMRGFPDSEVLDRAIAQNRIIITNDKELASFAAARKVP